MSSPENINEKGGSEGLVRQRRLFSFLLSKKVPPVPSQEERKPYPAKHCNYISFLMFWWLNPLLKVGYKRTLQAEDMFKLEEDGKVGYMYAKFLKNLKEQRSRQKSPEITQCTLNWALYKTFRYEVLMSTFILVVSNMASVVNPQLQKYLINFVENRASGLAVSSGSGVGYAIGCCAMMFLMGAAFNHSFYMTMLIGAMVKAALTKALLEKSYIVDAEGHHRCSNAKVTTMLSADLNRIDLALAYMAFGVVFPFPTIYAIIMLIVNIGVASLVGVALFIGSTILLGWTLRPMANMRAQANEFTDARVDLINELLNNFKITKLYSWENSYGKRIEDARNREVGYIMKLQNLRSSIFAYSVCLPTISSAIAFCVMFRMRNHRSVGSIFSSLSLFQALSMQFFMLPTCLSMATDYSMGMKRISAFLTSGEVPLDGNHAEPLESEPKVALKVVDGTFKWEEFDDDDENEGDSEKEATTTSEEEGSSATDKSDAEKSARQEFSQLDDVNLTVQKGEFVAIVGHIGSGKSSLLNALSGFMHKESGEVYCNGSLLLCGYPWVQNATVRDNITFGRPFDRTKYSEIIDACCLNADFDMLPGGDNTEVGERGVTLSGGQKARINLARAIYADRDIILMDDVLSAVDAKVGKRIMDRCIMGLLKNKTRILATHQLALISAADQLIFMNGDGTLQVGSEHELLETNAGFAHLMEYTNEKEKEAEREREAAGQSQEKVEEEELQLVRQQTQIIQDSKEARITQAEERAVNMIQGEVYKSYLKQGSGLFGRMFVPVLVMSMIISTFCLIFTNNWLTFWVQGKFAGRSDSFYMGIYLMFAFISLFWLVFCYWMLVYLSALSSCKLNLMAVNNLLHTPMSFIDTTPTGRILNRFAKDTDVLDNEMVQQLRLFCNPLCNVCGTIILCIIYLPWFAIAVPLLVFVYIFIASFYQGSSREIKRLEAIQRSLVFNHFNEALSGMDTIKAHKASRRFLDELDPYIDQMNEAYYLTNATQRWLAMNMSLIATVFAFGVALLCVFRVFNINASSTGLLLTYVLTISGQMSMLLRAMTQIENEMNSVERLNHYAQHLVQEPAYEIPERDPAPEWPADGRIVFNNVSLKYRPELPYVLKHISMDIKSRERIGFCGRTGAGKSTIMSCLFRLTEYEGTLSIDDVDISKLGLHTLRSRLSIIPQDPVLFEGTVRNNLDPFNEKSDEVLWAALKNAGLVEAGELAAVQRQVAGDENMNKFHLLHHVENDGTNYSLGERQLIALARALVRESRILILDEATSSVDYETDSKVQHTIATEFADCTILCIAHRLKTIVTYDRIVVLDQGEIKEFDTPKALFDTKDGIFRAMCDQSGITEEDFV